MGKSKCDTMAARKRAAEKQIDHNCAECVKAARQRIREAVASLREAGAKGIDVETRESRLINAMSDIGDALLHLGEARGNRNALYDLQAIGLFMVVES